jgi:cytochrome c peroxidase
MTGTLRRLGRAAVVMIVALSGTIVTAGRPAVRGALPASLAFGNAAGVLGTLTAGGSFDEENPFFAALGTNGRTCGTCHPPAQAWSITPSELAGRFERTAGLDPIFRANDGSNCEAADLSTLERRRRSFSALLGRGVIRLALDVPSGAEFEIVAVDDPYRCGSRLTSASLYRRPLPAANLSFLSAVMWDGRLSRAGRAIKDDLIAQAVDATVHHAEGVSPSAKQLREIVDFELGLVAAQERDRAAGSLVAAGARGGTSALAAQPFCIGINDPLSMRPPTPGACLSTSRGLGPRSLQPVLCVARLDVSRAAGDRAR